ncbi:hypothetical protein ANO11243_014180 [Dothideomycetidae sp. 11243]|nr:hypothetical protein ANO11243_014180 [fungal sp. No.11243]
MGLSGPKRRTKISADPNNTNWTRDSTSFGHRMLKQQGWTPGSYLGAVDAPHAAHYTAANASHVRVLLKDDTLGLGASRKREGAETFGLDQFSGLLGRLNGKESSVLKKEESNRRDVRLRLYQEGKFGGVRFISAGFLVGDEVKELKRSEVERLAGIQKSSEVAEVRKGKKRARNGDVKEEVFEPSQASSPSESEAGHSSPEEDQKAAKRQRKEERRQKRAEKALRRERRAAEKVAKAERRAQKLKRRQEGGVDKQTDADNDSTSEAIQSTSEPTNSGITSSCGSPAPSMLPRNSVRQRYIRQKRMAGLDPKALKEIFMIKSSA